MRRIILLLFLTTALLPPAASSEDRQSAWDTLLGRDPALADRASSLERELLQLMTPAQLDSYMAGPGSQIVLANGETLDEYLARKGASTFEISWSSIDGGGALRSRGGDFEVSGTLGQPDAGTMGGGDFTLTGGFWAITKGASVLFEDGFETGNTSRWSSSIGG